MARRFISIPEWVEESMFTPLRRTDRVFQLDPRGAPTNRPLFVSRDPEYVCARGYLLAARLAVEHIRHNGVDSPFLVYPIMFLYRHHMELMLKRLILKADEPGVRYFTNEREMSEDVREKLSKRHSLQWLWDQLRVTAEGCGTRREDVKAISSYIQQVNEIDPKSSGFRYATAIEETKIKLDKVQGHGGMLGIQNFAEAMERLAYCLENLDGYFADMIEAYHEMLADACDPSY